MKKVYFVRHGESEMNVKELEQGADGPLSELGRKQAEFVGKRFSNIPLDVIVSSTDERAQETAQIVNSTLGKEIVFTDYLIERRPPTKFIGTSHSDPEYKEVKKKITEGRLLDPSWKYDDEDSFTDIKNRAINALNFLRERGEESILAVTHAGTLRAILGVIIFGDDFTFSEYRKMYQSLKSKNTGIMLAEYDDSNKAFEPGWKLVTWNDHAHLG